MTQQQTLTAERVHDVLTACLFEEGEDTANSVVVEGVSQKFGFHPERLKEHRAEIEAMLMELPTEFRQSEGGGWSFLQGCMDKHGNQWGEQVNVEALFVLGIAIKKGSFPLPRDLWDVLPGGVPYFVVRDGKKEKP